MRKALLAAGLAALMAMPVMAEDVATLAEKIDRVDEVLYGLSSAVRIRRIM